MHGLPQKNLPLYFPTSAFETSTQLRIDPQNTNLKTIKCLIT